MSPARKTRSSARAAAAAGTQINNNDKKVNRKPGKKRVKILMDDNSSDDEPKITKFQVTSVHDGKKLSYVSFFHVINDKKVNRKPEKRRVKLFNDQACL